MSRELGVSCNTELPLVQYPRITTEFVAAVGMLREKKITIRKLKQFKNLQSINSQFLQKCQNFVQGVRT